MTEQGSPSPAAVEERRKPRSMWVRMISGTVVFVLVVVGGIFAFRADGKPVHDVALTDGSIWVSGGRTGNWGRINTGSHALDAIIGGAGETGETPGARVERPEILQDGRQVIGITGVGDGTQDDREIVSIDAVTGSPVKGRARVPATKITSGGTFFTPDVVALGGDTLAVVDHQNGNLWGLRLDPEGGTSIDGLTDEAPLENALGPGAAVAVSEDGDIMVVSAENGTVVQIPAEDDGFGSPERTDLPFEESRVADITAVGDDWVVLDPEEGMVHAEGLEEPQQVGDGGEDEELTLAALQQAGSESPVVAVQTTERAEFVSIDDDADMGSADPGVTSGLGASPPREEFVKISRPVRNGRCLYAAWGRGNGVLWGRACGEASTTTSELAIVGDLVRRSGVAVRHNRGQVLLNDLDTGRVFDLALTVDPRIDTWPEGAPRAEQERYTPDYRTGSSSPSTTAPRSRPSSTSRTSTPTSTTSG